MYIGSIVAFPPDEPQKELDFKSFQAMRALMSRPKEVSTFNEGTEHMSITVSEESATNIVYKFEGKRRNSADSYRTLQIVETRGFSGDVITTTYKPYLVK